MYMVGGRDRRARAIARSGAPPVTWALLGKPETPKQQLRSWVPDAHETSDAGFEGRLTFVPRELVRPSAELVPARDGSARPCVSTPPSPSPIGTAARLLVSRARERIRSYPYGLSTITSRSCAAGSWRQVLKGRLDFVKRILVATDFSEHADRALAVAIDFAKRFGATIDLLHVYSVPTPIAASFAGVPMPTPLPPPDELIGIQRHLDVLAESARGAGVDCLPATVEGNPRTQILAEAQKVGADLIVMGTHGRTGFRRVIFGSVAEHVLREAGLPVLVVPPARWPSGST